jgi:hypothetical protein
MTTIGFTSQGEHREGGRRVTSGPGRVPQLEEASS